MKRFKKFLCVMLVSALLAMLFSSCAGSEKPPKLDPDNPVTVTVWHYYNGVLLNAFESAVNDFNETVGAKEGIIIEGRSFGRVTDLEEAIMQSANKEIGSIDLPDIFASYADTAYSLEQLDLLANLADYFTAGEQSEYFASFIEEGKIGIGGELRIFPVAKATEVMILNETDWLIFADANDLNYDDLSTMEGVARVSEIYYNWSGGKAFFGRDVMPNLFIIAAKQFGTEIFKVESGAAVININKDAMRKIWDYYYVPYISGYYLSAGRFRSDDTRVGDIIAYVGSTASAAYFPAEVTSDGATHSITAKVLAAPLFEGGTKVMVQQGAGMVVTKSTPEKQYASLIFLKWFTDIKQNISFSLLSGGYLPVKQKAIDYDLIKSEAAEADISFSPVTDETFRIAIDSIKSSELYTTKAFNGGVEARAVLESHLQDKAAADRESVISLINGGSPHEQAVAQFNTEENFNIWLDDITKKLNEAAK